MKKILLSMLSLVLVISVNAQCESVDAYLSAMQGYYNDTPSTEFFNFGTADVDTTVCPDGILIEVLPTRFIMANITVTDASGTVLVDSLFHTTVSDVWGNFGPYSGYSFPVKQYDADMEGCAGVAYPAGFFDGHIALIARGSCSFVEKTVEAEAAGAEGALIHNATLGGGADPTDELLFMGAAAGTDPNIASIPAMGTSFDSGIFIQDDLDVGNTVTISLVDEAIDSYQWVTYDGAAYAEIAGEVSNQFLADIDGTYSCALFTAAGCQFPLFSNVNVTVTIDAAGTCPDNTAIGTPELNASITAFPNPSTGMISLDLTDLNEVANVSVMNVAGEQVVAPARYNNELVSMDLNSLSNGVYFVQIVSEGASTTRKITILK